MNMKKIIKTYLGIAFALFLAVSCDTENKGAMYTPEANGHWRVFPQQHIR